MTTKRFLHLLRLTVCGLIMGASAAFTFHLQPGPTTSSPASADQPTSPTSSSASNSSRKTPTDSSSDQQSSHKLSERLDRRRERTASVPLREKAFRHELRAFSADLLTFAAKREGVQLSTRRARQLAWWAVSDAYRYQIPPSMIFGVMLVENPWFEGWRTSSAGAVGLMQIMPEVWLSECGPRFGSNLESDRSNMRCGTMVLAHYANLSGGWWKETLWRYNGWGRTYPGKVRQRVEEYAQNLCPDRSFEACVSQPLYIAYRPEGQTIAQKEDDAENSTG